MYGIIFMGLIMLMVMSSGAFTVTMMLDNVTSLLSSQSEAQNKKRIEILLNHSLKPYGDEQALVAPIDFSSTVEYNGETYLTLPSFLGIGSYNYWKMPYIYCPVSGDSETISSSSSSEEITYGDSTYSVVAFDDSIDDGIDYVLESNLSIDSELSDKHTLAIVISPRTNTDIPSCSDVYIKSNGSYGFTATDGKSYSGLITVISRDEASRFTGIPNYTVDIDDFDEDATLNHIISSWESIQPLKYTFDWNDGSEREMTSDISFENDTPSLAKTIELKNTSSTTQEVFAESEMTMSFKNMSVSISNIDFSSNINLEFENAKVRFDDVRASGVITLTNSTLEIVSDSSLSSSESSPAFVSVNSSVIQNGADFTITNGLSASAISMSETMWAMDESTLTVSSNSGSGSDVIDINDNSFLTVKDGSTLEINSSSGDANSALSVDFGSSVSVSDSSITSSNSADVFIDLEGKMMMNDSSFIPSSSVSTAFNINSGSLKLYSSKVYSSSSISIGFNLKNGSTLVLEDSTVGSSSNNVSVGIKDTSASSVYGDDSTVYATTCFSGYLFEELSSDSYSTPSDDSVQESANRSEWLCQ